MRTAIVLSLVVLCGVLLCPAGAPAAVPLDGITLVAEQRAADVDLAAAGKSGNSGKNGKSGKNGNAGGSSSTADGYFNTYYTLFGAGAASDRGSLELVTVALR